MIKSILFATVLFIGVPIIIAFTDRSTMGAIIFFLVLAVVIYHEEYRGCRAKAEQHIKDWEFCKKLLDNERAKNEIPRDVD